MKKIITAVIIVLATNMAMAQKASDVPVNTEIDATKAKSHSNTNTNRQENNAAPKVGIGNQAVGEAGKKRKIDWGKWIKRK